MANATTTQPLSQALPGVGTNIGITSNDTADSLGQYFQLTLTAAQLISMFTTPIVILPASLAGLGRSILVDYVMCRYTSGGTAFTGGGAISLQYTGGAQVAGTLPAATINSTTSSDTILGLLSSNVTALQNTAITITNATAAFATGNGTLQVQVHYSIN